MAALLLIAVQAFAAQALSSEAPQNPAQISGNQEQTTVAGDPQPAGAPTKKAPQARTRGEYDAYQSAAVESEPARLEVEATEFAQRFPASELRPYLFQRAMGLYQQRNDSAKTLQMARAVLKYDPANSVALLGAAQVLAESAHDHDLDRNPRLQEAADDAQLALQHAGELPQPAGLSAEQFESMILELRGEAHEVLGTIAYKKRDFRSAVDEYNAAAAGEKEHTGTVLWLRLAAAHDKLGEYSLGIAALEKALSAYMGGSEAPGTPASGSWLSAVREIVQKELVRLRALAAEAASKPAPSPEAGPAATAPSATPTPAPGENQPIQKTESFRSPAAGQ